MAVLEPNEVIVIEKDSWDESPGANESFRGRASPNESYLLAEEPLRMNLLAQEPLLKASLEKHLGSHANSMPNVYVSQLHARCIMPSVSSEPSRGEICSASDPSEEKYVPHFDHVVNMHMQIAMCSGGVWRRVVALPISTAQTCSGFLILLTDQEIHTTISNQKTKHLT